MSMSYILTNDHVRLAYSDVGDGPTMIFLPGYSDIKETWYFQSKYFSENGYRIICLDWRSHGCSSHTAKNMKIMRLAADLHELITTLKLENVILIGHSMGASVIWAYVTIFGQTNVSKIITVDESPKLINDVGWQAGIKNLNWDNFIELAPLILQQPLTEQQMPATLKNIRNRFKTDHPFDADLGYGLLLDHMKQDWRTTVINITVPQLFVVGDKSPLWAGDYSNYCEKKNNINIFKTLIKNTGHFPQIEDAERFNSEINFFLKNT